MKKLLIKDKNLRQNLKNYNKKYFLLKIILKNYNIFSLSRFKAVTHLNELKFYNVSISDRCIVSFNKKKFNKFFLYFLALTSKACNQEDCSPRFRLRQKYDLCRRVRKICQVGLPEHHQLRHGQNYRYVWSWGKTMDHQHTTDVYD